MSQPLDIGSVLGGGRYVVEKVLGIGGFGITYYVRHKGLGSYCAIKEMFLDGRCVRAYDRKTVELQGLDNSFYDKLRKSFVAEARFLTRLHNPHIVKVFDIFDENNTSYMVMEFVPGTTLQELIKLKGKIPFDDAINIMGQLSEAVAIIHKENVLHRDIKPDNIIITPENNVVLIDFGAAREFVQNQTQRHTVILTPGFAPIEQYNDTGRRGNYTDIYAMGGVLYYMLTGIIPMVATERAMEAMASPKELNPAIPKTISDTIMKAMAFKPEDRYQTVDAFLAALLSKSEVDAVSQKPQPASPAESNQRVNRPVENVITKKKSKTGLFIGITLGGLVIIAIIVKLLLAFEPDAPLHDDEKLLTNTQSVQTSNFPYNTYFEGTIGSNGSLEIDALGGGYYTVEYDGKPITRTIKLKSYDPKTGSLIIEGYKTSGTYVGLFRGVVNDNKLYSGTFTNVKGWEVSFRLRATSK